MLIRRITNFLSGTTAGHQRPADALFRSYHHLLRKQAALKPAALKPLISNPFDRITDADL